MNVLIAGAGVMAHRIAEALMADHQVVSLRETNESGTGFDRLDIETVSGSATSPKALTSARVRSANFFIACTGNDEQNIVACLAAQKLGADKTVCVLSRPGFFSLQEHDQDLADSLGIHVVVRPGEQLANEIVRIITVPGALDVRYFFDGRVGLLRYRVEAGAPILSGPLKSLRLPRGVILVNIRRDEDMVVPRGDTQVMVGDHVLAMGKPAPMQEFARVLRQERQERPHEVAIVGAGSVGVAIAAKLEKAGWSVKLIEVDKGRCEEAANQLRSMVLHGDGGDLDLLEQERIGDASVVVCVTNNDEKNLLVSLLAKSLGVPRIITRADRLSNERMFEKVGVDVVLSKGGAAIRSIIDQLDTSHAEIRAELEHGSTCVLELNLSESFAPQRLNRLRPPEHAIVGAITRGREVLIPGGSDQLLPGDEVLVFCRTADEKRVRQFFSETGNGAGDG